jgi:hypothetical protein
MLKADLTHRDRAELQRYHKVSLFMNLLVLEFFWLTL